MMTKTIVNEMSVFNFGEREVRTVLKNGEPWFVAKDVTYVLGINQTQIRRLNEKQKGLHTIQTLGGEQQLSVINEAGVYKLVFTSRKQEAELFSDWIAEEVLPSIRKHGAYLRDDVLTRAEIDPTYMQSLLTNLTEERIKRIQAEKTISLLAPKVEAFDSFLDSTNTMTITEVGKTLGISGIKLCEILRNHGILLKIPKNVPAQKYLDKGYFTVKYSKKNDGNGNHNVLQTRVTALGADFIYRLLKYNKDVA